MEEKRKLKLKAIPSVDNGWLLQVIEQTHRKEEFGNDITLLYNGSFQAKNNISILSAAHPTYLKSEKALYVRGYIKEEDDIYFYVPDDHLKDIADAVKEYNETFGGTDANTIHVFKQG